MKIVSLGEICDLQNGYAFKSSDYVSFSNTLNCRMSNVRPNGKFDVEYAPKYLPDEYAKTYSNFLLRDGDIVIAMTDMANDPKILGVPTIVNTKGKNMLLNQRVGKLILLKENQVNISYLQYSLNRTSVKKYYTQFAGGGLQLNVGKKEILSVKIPLPPLETQQKIAAILDAADTLRQKDKALVAKYDELTQALFLDMFGDPVSNPKGWEKLSGRVVFKLIGGAAFKSSDYTSQGLPLIRIGTVNKGYFDNAQLTFLPSSFAKSHSKYLVYPDDLLITLTGTVGKDDYGNAFALTNEFEKYLLNQRVAKICNSEKHHLVFLKFFLKQNKVKNELIGVSRGVRQANLSNEDFYKLDTITPPLNIQTQFAERVAIIEKQKAIAQTSLGKSEELFNSLLQKAFKGELA